jgi:hypothetical protein
MKTCLVQNYAQENLYNTARNIDRIRTQPETSGTSLVFGNIRSDPALPPRPYSSRDYRSTSKTWRKIVCLAGNPLAPSPAEVTAAYLHYVRSGQEVRTQCSTFIFSGMWNLRGQSQTIRMPECSDFCAPKCEIKRCSRSLAYSVLEWRGGTVDFTFTYNL